MGDDVLDDSYIAEYKCERFKPRNNNYRPDLYDSKKYTINEKGWELFEISYIIRYYESDDIDDFKEISFDTDYSIFFWSDKDNGGDAIKDLLNRLLQLKGIIKQYGFPDHEGQMFFDWLTIVAPDKCYMQGDIQEIETTIKHYRYCFRKFIELYENITQHFSLEEWEEIIL